MRTDRSAKLKQTIEVHLTTLAEGELRRVGLDQTAQYPWAHRLCELPNQPWKKPREHEELYHIETDPHEQTNLTEDPNDLSVLNGMRDLLDRHMEETEDPYLGAPFTHDYSPVQ